MDLLILEKKICYLRILKHIAYRNLQRNFTIWNINSKSSKKQIPLLRIKKFIKANNTKSNAEANDMKPSKSKSPIESGIRLHAQAKEIQQRKDLLKKNCDADFSFTPRVIKSSKKNNKIIRKKTDIQENVAVVSAHNNKTANQFTLIRSLTPF